MEKNPSARCSMIGHFWRYGVCTVCGISRESISARCGSMTDTVGDILRPAFIESPKHEQDGDLSLPRFALNPISPFRLALPPRNQEIPVEGS